MCQKKTPLIDSPFRHWDSPTIANAIESISQGGGASQRSSFEPLRQYHSKEIHRCDTNAGQKRNQAVEYGARVDVASHALPLDPALRLGERGRGEPPHAEAQRQGISNDQLPSRCPGHVAQRTGAVGDPGVQDAAVVGVYVVFRCAVQQHVHVCRDVHVAELQGAREREDQRYVLLGDGLLVDDLDVGRRAGREPAGEGRVGVDVKLEEVEEGVADHGDGAVHFALDAVVELERLVGLLADREGYPLELMVLWVFDVLACFSAPRRCQFLIFPRSYRKAT